LHLTAPFAMLILRDSANAGARMLKSPVSSSDHSAEPREVDRPAEVAPADEVLGFFDPLNGLAAAAAASRDEPRPPVLTFFGPMNGSAAAATAGRLSTGEVATDAVIAAVIDEVVSDPEAIGLLLHGSRAAGTASAHSNYDFACLLAEDAWERRRERGTAVELRFRAGSPMVEIAYESVGRLRQAARVGSPRGATFALARVLLDKTGEIPALLDALVAAEEPVRDSVADEYDGYLHGFAHSLKALSRGDDLGARAHAAQSGLHLVRALFGLEGRRAPYLDQLWVRLAELDEPQGWRPGSLYGALHRLFYAPDPPFQQMLERRVSRLMESRGIQHGWRHDLDRLRVVSYDEL
jgi:hypothetical protein